VPNNPPISETPREGVVQYTFDLIEGSPGTESELAEATRCRQELYIRDAIGCDLSRYGACYGNLSFRTGAFAAGPGRREFLVSCTKSGGLPSASGETMSRVLHYDHEKNYVLAQGPCAPSSESMTHGAIYDASLEVRAVVHGHDPQLWQYLLQHGAPYTEEHILYGTPPMAEAAAKLVRDNLKKSWRLPGVFAMAGHEDGVVAWGASLTHATERFLHAWHESRHGWAR